jgi:peptidoglycan-associated lipoprotein
MRNRFWVVLALLLVIPGLMLTTSCAKKQVQSGAEVTPPPEEGVVSDEDARARALEEQRLREQRAAAAARERFENQDIHFDFDKSSLTPAAQAILRDKAAYLMANTNVSVIIEGHCDERGTNEYNMALGDRRAASAKNFLVDLGVASRRLTTISYGEEKPIDPASNEAAWEKNRRAHFVID